MTRRTFNKISSRDAIWCGACFAVGVVLFATYWVGWWQLPRVIGMNVSQVIAAPFVALNNQLHQSLDYLGKLQSIEQENVRLQKELLQAKVDLRNLEELKSESQWLRGQLGLKLVPNLTKGTLGRVVKYEQAPAPGYMYIDTEDNIVWPGALVLSKQYVVGEIVDSFGQFAKVRLIYANEFQHPVLVNGKYIARISGARGVAAKITEIEARATLTQNQSVVLWSDKITSQLLLGTLKPETGNANAATQSGELVTPIDIYNLTFVTVQGL